MKGMPHRFVLVRWVACFAVLQWQSCGVSFGAGSTSWIPISIAHPQVPRGDRRQGWVCVIPGHHENPFGVNLQKHQGIGPNVCHWTRVFYIVADDEILRHSDFAKRDETNVRTWSPNQ